QQAVLQGLGRVPLVIGRVARWSDDWREGRLRLDQFVDGSMSDAGLPDDDLGAAGLADDQDEAGGPEARQPGPRRGPEKSRADGDADGEPKLAPGVAAQLDLVAARAHEIGDLIRKRAAALARGRDIAKKNIARLQGLIAGFGAELAGLHLHPDRV